MTLIVKIWIKVVFANISAHSNTNTVNATVIVKTKNPNTLQHCKHYCATERGQQCQCQDIWQHNTLTVHFILKNTAQVLKCCFYLLSFIMNTQTILILMMPREIF